MVRVPGPIDTCEPLDMPCACDTLSASDMLPAGFEIIDTEMVEALPSLKMVRLVRLLRILKAIRGFAEINKISSALLVCLKPVSYAFLLLLVFTCIYAVVGTHLYRQRAPAFFGSFSASLFSMFQVVASAPRFSALAASLPLCHHHPTSCILPSSLSYHSLLPRHYFMCVSQFGSHSERG